jgi:hypothetical protein
MFSILVCFTKRKSGNPVQFSYYLKNRCPALQPDPIDIVTLNDFWHEEG